MKTYGDLFTGFGGATIGAMVAGLTPLWGVEYRADVAAIANSNLGGHVVVADILDCNPATFAPVDVLHASPPCPNFSVAKTGGAETPHDLALAAKVAEFVTVLRPGAFTLENVMAYKDSQSWRMIEQALFDAGYWIAQDVVNSADYGVPQTRKRLIVRAVLGGFVPYLPERVSQWIGWYAAVEDLLPGLPDSKLAPWQLKRLPEKLTAAIAFSSNGNNDSWGEHHVEADEPMLSVTAQTLGRSRAVLVESRNTSDGFGFGQRQEDEPAPTVCVVDRPSHAPKAVLITGQYGQPNTTDDRTAQRSDSGDPSFTVTAAAKGDIRAVLLTNGQYDGVVISADQHEPANTVTSNTNQTSLKAVLPTRVVSMSSRCLARFQSFPDWYELPPSRTLAALGIGNAAPPLLMQKIFEGLIHHAGRDQ